jgi:sodium/hydrogen antiporter
MREDQRPGARPSRTGTPACALPLLLFMTTADVIVLLLGLLVLGLGLPSRLLARSPLPPELCALIVGVAIGPIGLGFVNIEAMGERHAIVETLARLALGIGLVGVALRVPRQYPRQEWRELAVLVGIGMPLMWFSSTALVWLIVGVPFWVAALIGAMITPTDPIGASPVVTGELAERHLPGRVRHLISFESGVNDGVSYLIVFLPLLLLTRPQHEAISHWLLHTLLWEVGAATVLGMFLGWLAARLLHAAARAELIDGDWRLVYTVALALLAVGTGRGIGSDELLVAFAAGATFVQLVAEHEREEEEHGQEAVNRFFAVPLFAVIGTLIPWDGWLDLGWSAPLLLLAVLLLRRPPTLIALRPLLPNLNAWRDILFVGWFGPIAIAALYYAAVAEAYFDEAVVWHVVTLMIVGSCVIHGATAAAGTRLYGRARARSQARP